MDGVKPDAHAAGEAALRMPPVPARTLEVCVESLHSSPFQMAAAGGRTCDPASEPLASAALDLCRLCATCMATI